jgi:hypothetical protein
MLLAHFVGDARRSNHSSVSATLGGLHMALLAIFFIVIGYMLFGSYALAE